jgi:uncharacterized RDD family membrane protein YckC
MEMAEAPQVSEASHERRLLAAYAQRAFWWRVGAVVIDLLVLSLVNALVDFVFGVTHVTGGSPVPPPGGTFTVWTSSTDVGWEWQLLIVLAYYIVLEGLFGATVGKWALKLRVATLDGQRPGFRAILLRNLVRPVDGLPVGYLFGGILALLSPFRRRLGDRLARTIVIPREALAAPRLTPEQLRRRLALLGAILVVCLAFCAGFFYYGRPPLVVQSMVNTRQMMFDEGVRSYALSAPTWGEGTVTYRVTFVTEQPVQTCHALLTLRFQWPDGWAPSDGVTNCGDGFPAGYAPRSRS